MENVDRMFIAGRGICLPATANASSKVSTFGVAIIADIESNLIFLSKNARSSRKVS